MQALQTATLKARAACGVPVCTRAGAGRVQVGYHLGRAFIALSEWGSIAQAIETLNAIERDKGFR